MSEQPNLWQQSTEAAHALAIATLVPLARELAERAGAHGVTVSDLRLTAVQRRLLPQTGEGRSLSYLGAVMRAAGLVATGQTRRSTIAGSHGNRHVVWRDPRYRS